MWLINIQTSSGGNRNTQRKPPPSLKPLSTFNYFKQSDVLQDSYNLHYCQPNQGQHGPKRPSAPNGLKKLNGPGVSNGPACKVSTGANGQNMSTEQSQPGLSALTWQRCPFGYQIFGRICQFGPFWSCRHVCPTWPFLHIGPFLPLFSISSSLACLLYWVNWLFFDQLGLLAQCPI